MAGIDTRVVDGVLEARHTVAVTAVQWLSEETFEIRFQRPSGFAYDPGQWISIIDGPHRRDYTLLGPTDADELALCIRVVTGGRLTPKLAQAREGDRFRISAPSGFFVYKASPRQTVFVATGTGIAPFVAYARSGVAGYDLLHGGRTVSQLYYREVVSASAHRYIPCITGDKARSSMPDAFSGRVDQYLSTVHPEGVYDFYLCGQGDMIRDVTRVIDGKFPESRVFMEAFD